MPVSSEFCFEYQLKQVENDGLIIESNGAIFCLSAACNWVTEQLQCDFLPQKSLDSKTYVDIPILKPGSRKDS